MPDARVRDAIRAQYQEQMGSLSSQLDVGTLSLDDWHAGMKQALRDSYALNLRAGSDAPLKYTEYLQLGNPLQAQYRYLSDFRQAIASGAVSGDAIATRAKLYALSAVEMYWRQVTKGANLPAWPPEHPHCDCEWVEEDNGWHWVLGDTDNSCPVCVERSQTWNPYAASEGE